MSSRGDPLQFMTSTVVGRFSRSRHPFQSSAGAMQLWFFPFCFAWYIA